MQFEDRLRDHLAGKAETVEVPSRRLEVTPRPAPTGRRAFATGVATVAVLASVIGVSLASGSPEPAEDLPDLELPAIAGMFRDPNRPLNGLFAWEAAGGVEAEQLVEMSDGTILAFGPADPVTRRGLRMWSYAGTGGWEAHGTTMGTAYVTPQIQSGANLVAVTHGSPWATRFPELVGGTLFTSSDGRTWHEHTPPMVTDPPHATVELVVAGDPGALVRAVDPSPAEAFAWQDVGADYAESAFVFSVVDDGSGGANLVIDALELPVDTITSGTPRSGSPSADETTRFWRTTDYQTWAEVEMPNLEAEIVAWKGFYDGSRYVVTAMADQPESTSYFLTSTDLASWEVAAVSTDLHDLQPAGLSGYLARQDGRQRPRLMFSEDLVDWEPVTSFEVDQQSGEYADAVGVGELGTALVYGNPLGAPRPPMALVLSDGFRVGIDRQDSFLVVLTEEGEALGIDYNSSRPDPSVEFSPETDSLAIHTESAGTVEVTARSVLAALRSVDHALEFDSAMLFSTDLERWTLIDVTAESEAIGAVEDVLVTDDAVYIAYGPSGETPAQVWVGRMTGAP